MLRKQVLHVSQNGMEKDISLTWKIRRVLSNYVCVFKFVYVCVFVWLSVRWGKMWDG